MSLANLPKEYFFKEGCFIQEWHNSSDDEAFSVARVRVEALAQTRLHALTDTSERYIILSGQGEVSVDGVLRVVSEGDVVVILAGQSQKIRNLSTQDLIFLAVCSPRFREHNYQDLEI